ncbi:MAG: competence/damage-inducible protein A [Ramlibacter sp.]|jgi:molybdopterin-biosynthesis enzyme MoeA-like protein|nr:competence/damage-inducible protein A [Ramlibacter sp.]
MSSPSHSRPSEATAPGFGLIIVGDEILSGKRADKHLPKVIELLAARGLSLSWAEYVGDDPVRITATLRRAFAGPDIVFSTGGIGATPDDHTRQCAAAALGLPLQLHPGAEALIRERMQDVAREQGTTYEPDRPDNIHRFNMGVFPQGAQLIPNPFNKIPGFYVTRPARDPSAPPGGSDARQVGEGGGVYFVPGFPVMAWPMVEWVLDTQYAHLHRKSARLEKSVIVYGAMEAALTPLMEEVERLYPGVKVFSLPSVDHPVHGRHIELGVKGVPEATESAYAHLLQGLQSPDIQLGPEMVHNF